MSTTVPTHAVVLLERGDDLVEYQLPSPTLRAYFLYLAGEVWTHVGEDAAGRWIYRRI